MKKNILLGFAAFNALFLASVNAQPASTGLLSSIVTLPVTQQGFVNRVAQLANTADTNKNGLLEPAEQAASSGKLLAGANLGAHLPECHNLNVMRSLTTYSTGNKPVPVTEITSSAGKVFRFLDSNNDGTLTTAEEQQTVATVRRTCAQHGALLQRVFDARGHFNLAGLQGVNPLELNQAMQDIGPLIRRAQAL